MKSSTTLLQEGRLLPVIVLKTQLVAHRSSVLNSVSIRILTRLIRDFCLQLKASPSAVDMFLLLI
jgi:hypothetical protein